MTSTVTTASGTPRLQTPAAPGLGTIYRLADHLDATLAMTEDLLRQALDVVPQAAGDSSAAVAARNDALSKFARAIRAIELGITARVMQARARAIELRPVHKRFDPLIALFVGGTASLADASAQRGDWLGDISETALRTGSDVLEFLRSRALVDESTRSLSGVGKIQVSEDYLVARQIHLGSLMDMIAKFLDALDLAFEIYAEPRTSEE